MPRVVRCAAAALALPLALAVADIERFERGENFLMTKRISDPPRLEAGGERP